jgi:dihydrofolate reductase
MGKIISNFFIAFDGVVERPDQWHFPYFDDAMGAIVGQGMQTQTSFLMGRRLYDEWSQYWPQQGPEVPFSEHINNLPKYVITHRPIEGELWTNTTNLGADPVEELRRIKESSDGDIGMSGCATTVRWLLAKDLIDELALIVHPIAVG